MTTLLIPRLLARTSPNIGIMSQLVHPLFSHNVGRIVMKQLYQGDNMLNNLSSVTDVTTRIAELSKQIADLKANGASYEEIRVLNRHIQDLHRLGYQLSLAGK